MPVIPTRMMPMGWKPKLSARSYINGGLVCALDSIETKGYGKEAHEDGNTLSDLVTKTASGVVIGTGLSQFQYDYAANPKLLRMVSGQLSGIVFSLYVNNLVKAAIANKTYTFEVCGLYAGSAAGGISFGTYDATYGWNILRIGLRPTYNTTFSCGGVTRDIYSHNVAKLATLSIRRDAAGNVKCFINGSGVAEFTATNDNAPSLGFYMYKDVAFGSHRFYSRALTDEEIAANRAVDVARFNPPTT